MEKAERFNTLSHLVGAVAACGGLVVLDMLAVRQGDIWKIVSFSIYGLTMILVYTFSTLYHGLQGELKRMFAKLDHQSIYLFIAGTYTPVALVTLRGVLGWLIFSAVWGLAVLGIALEIWSRGGSRVFSVVIYLVMGWMILIALDPLLEAIPFEGFVWLISGGLFYTVGVAFYALDHKVDYFHNIWHIFVLAGSISHYFAILFYVA
ncbi:hemolysin III [Methylomagnum ishizawai]|uniref:Hemolysin III n=1 Tax=Methylomagnum ishizawai TaxID=1760988 RepID=A0A1Y6DBU7_9GAMM|nr:hemolysin III family protein [Methylomagnum ishizawai]SMF97722.1 hemolysin III [Methylomagnum ishizawai]